MNVPAVIIGHAIGVIIGVALCFLCEYLTQSLNYSTKTLATVGAVSDKFVFLESNIFTALDSIEEFYALLRTHHLTESDVIPESELEKFNKSLTWFREYSLDSEFFDAITRDPNLSPSSKACLQEWKSRLSKLNAFEKELFDQIETVITARMLLKRKLSYLEAAPTSDQ